MPDDEVREPTQETIAIAEVLKETDRATLARAIVLAGPAARRKLVQAVALSELKDLAAWGELVGDER